VEKKFGGRLSPIAVLSGVLFAAGLVLALAVHPAFPALAGLAVFGVDLLRYAGLLRDFDEFRLRALHRSGMLMTGKRFSFGEIFKWLRYKE
jgi:hypothetical protein